MLTSWKTYELNYILEIWNKIWFSPENLFFFFLQTYMWNKIIKIKFITNYKKS